MRGFRTSLLWVLLLSLPLAVHAPPLAGPLSAHADADSLAWITAIETGGQPSAIVVDQAPGRHDVVFYDGDRVRFIDGDTLALTADQIVLPTTAWYGWMAYDTHHQQAYVVTVLRRETPMRVYWKEAQAHIVAGRALLGTVSVNGIYNTNPTDPVDRFYGFDGLTLKQPSSEGANPVRLILDDTANGNIDVVDLNTAGTDAAARYRYSYRDSLCAGSSCSWTDNHGNSLALEDKHESASPDDLATVDHVFIADPNWKGQDGFPLYGHIRALQIGHPGQPLNATALPAVDISGSWPFGNGNQGITMAAGRDVLYVASGQQSFDTGYIGEVHTTDGTIKQVPELTYGDLNFVHVDRQDPLRAFVCTFDGWYNDPVQGLYLHLLYDGTVVDSLKLMDNYDEYSGLRDMVYDPVHRRLYLTVDSQVMVVQVYVTTTCPAPLTGAEISGPALGEIGTTYTYRALTTPAGPTPPITYTWSPAPLTGQGTSEATYAWPSAGDFPNAVQVENCAGMYTPTLDVKIVAGELERVHLPLVVR